MTKFDLMRARLATGALALMVTASMAGSASAQTVGSIATSLRGQVSSVGVLITVVSFVLGVALAIAGLMKFRAHSQNPNDPSNKMSTAFVLMFAGAGLVAVPAVLGTGIATVFGSSAATTNGTTGFNSL
ncbi:hypothetical protein [Paracoccus sp. ME4]|uniref:hypothetical protein n=1 Tax=Paracoccus sp. ME4 TaxID=3138066 RepID=UPI00398B5E78